MLKIVLKVLFYLCAFISIIMFLPGSILLDIKPKAFTHPLPKAFEGALKPNDYLSKATKLFEDKIVGPESLAVFNGKIVTGADDGFIYQIDGNNLKPLVRLIENKCDNEPWNKTNCGRPLGIKFDSKGVLYVVEIDFGVFSVEDIFTNEPKVKQVFDIKETEALGKPSKFLDDLTIDEGAGLNGGHVLYMSDVSTKFDLSQLMLTVGGSDTGRIIKYDINAKTVETIADNLLFPNGLEITDDKSAILFVEFIARQVSKHYIRGPKKGQTEVILTAIPGEPDNIRRSASKQETYWIGVSGLRTSAKPNELDYYLKKPLLRKLLCRVFHLFGNGIELIGSIFNNSLIEEYGYNFKTGLIAMDFLIDDSHGTVIEIDNNGKIINSLHSPNGTISSISEAREVRISENETVLYLGSFVNHYIGKLNLNR